MSSLPVPSLPAPARQRIGVHRRIQPTPGVGLSRMTRYPGFGGRVLTGVVRDEVDGRFTPLALAVPTQFVVEFDLDWTVV